MLFLGIGVDFGIYLVDRFLIVIKLKKRKLSAKYFVILRQNFQFALASEDSDEIEWFDVLDEVLDEPEIVEESPEVTEKPVESEKSVPVLVVDLPTDGDIIAVSWIIVFSN